MPVRTPTPTLTAVALSTAYIKLGELVRRAFGGRESFILEKDRIPLVAIVSARDWMDYLAEANQGRDLGVRRDALSNPRGSATKRRRRKSTKPAPKASATRRARPKPRRAGRAKARR